jgi:GNAT superfamily N-acetyltransferase
MPWRSLHDYALGFRNRKQLVTDNLQMICPPYYLVRPVTVTQTDEPFLWEMLYYAVFVPPGTTPPERSILQQPELSRYVQRWRQPHDAGVVAVEQERRLSIGAAWLRLLTGENKGYGYVDETTPELTIAVAPPYRGMGVGTTLLSQLLTTAESRYPAVSLSVSAENPAFQWYRRLGFEVVGKCGTSLTMRRKCGLATLRSAGSPAPGACGMKRLGQSRSRCEDRGSKCVRRWFGFLQER